MLQILNYSLGLVLSIYNVFWWAEVLSVKAVEIMHFFLYDFYRFLVYFKNLSLFRSKPQRHSLFPTGIDSCMVWKTQFYFFHVETQHCLLNNLLFPHCSECGLCHRSSFMCVCMYLYICFSLFCSIAVFLSPASIPHWLNCYGHWITNLIFITSW